jgi:REP element-mobilizing transposase RayT
VSGGFYHVILRGNHREPLFRNEADRGVLNAITADVIERFHLRVHAFCWMTNHLHLAVQGAETPLGQPMQRIAMRYSRYFHKRTRRIGHLFERRYRAILVDADSYLLELVRYIHRNPVRAGMVTDAEDYPWSSHRAYLGRAQLPWLATDFVLAMFGSTVERAREQYRRFMADPGEVDAEILENGHRDDDRVLGSDDFVQRLPAVVAQKKPQITLADFIAERSAGLPVTLTALRSTSRRRNYSAARAALAAEALDQQIATLSEIARYFNRDASALARSIDRYRYVAPPPISQ